MSGRPLHGSPQLGGHSYPSLAETNRSRRPASLSGSGTTSHHNSALLHHQHQRTQQAGSSRHSLSGPSAPSPPVTASSSHSKHPQPMKEQRSISVAMGHGPTSSIASQSHHVGQQPGVWAMPQMRHFGGPTSQSTPTEQTKKSKSRKKNRSNMTDTDRPCQEHSFITDVNDIQNMQDGLLRLMRDFETGKLSAFDEHCSFEKMNNVRDLQEKLGRMHFKMEIDIQNAGANTKEGIDIATQNMDHLLSNLDQLSMAIANSRSLHPPGDPSAFHQDPPV